MGKFLTPYSIAIGEENNYFVTPHSKFFKRGWIVDGESLNRNESSFDPFD